MILKSEYNLLLNSVIHLRKRYALVDKLSAKPFNIFTILRTERNERFTHSAFIAELLNPNGSHCQGDIFLKLFLIEIQWSEIATIDISKTKITVEQYTGDGYIDLWVDLVNACICIENKIDAGDQKNQLLRYHNFCVSHKKPYKIIYLTLDGHDSEDAKVETDFDYLRWSYREQIIPWLELCIKETARIPALRETIYQYQQLLKKLCGMLQNENEATELNNLLKKDYEHFEAAHNIHEQFKIAKYEVKYSFWNDIVKHFSEKYTEKFLVEFSFKQDEKYPKIIIGHKYVEEWYACFCIEGIQGRPYYGIYSYDYGSRNGHQKEVIDGYSELFIRDFEQEGYWFSWKYYDNIDFYTINTLANTFSLDREKLIRQIIEPFEDLIKKYGDRILQINEEIHKKLSD